MTCPFLSAFNFWTCIMINCSSALGPVFCGATGCVRKFRVGIVRNVVAFRSPGLFNWYDGWIAAGMGVALKVY